MIADEPTTALVTVQAQILELIKEMAATNMAVIFISHDLGVVAGSVTASMSCIPGTVESGATDAIFAQPSHPTTSPAAVDPRVANQ